MSTHKEWFSMSEQEPRDLSHIKFVTKRNGQCVTGLYAFDMALRSVHLGKYYRGDVYSFSSDSMNRRTANKDVVDRWAYIDLSGPEEES